MEFTRKIITDGCTEVESNKDSKCWNCKNTDRNRCGWFDRPAVMPRGAKYRKKKNALSAEGYLIIITDCPNFTEDKTSPAFRAPVNICERKTTRHMTKDVSYAGVIKPPEKVYYVDHRVRLDRCVIGAYLRYVLNIDKLTICSAAKRIGINKETAGKIVNGCGELVILPSIYNKVAGYINDRMGWN